MKTGSPLPAASVTAGDQGRAITRTIGSVLRRVRTERGMSRKDLASRLLIHPDTLQRMENGDPSVQIGFYLGACHLVGLPLAAVEVDEDLAARALSRTDKPRARRIRRDLFS